MAGDDAACKNILNEIQVLVSYWYMVVRLSDTIPCDDRVPWSQKYDYRWFVI